MALENTPASTAAATSVLAAQVSLGVKALQRRVRSAALGEAVLLEVREEVGDGAGDHRVGHVRVLGQVIRSVEVGVGVAALELTVQTVVLLGGGEFAARHGGVDVQVIGQVIRAIESSPIRHGNSLFTGFYRSIPAGSPTRRNPERPGQGCPRQASSTTQGVE